MKGYIKLYRQFLNWEWYKDPNTSRLFIHCLLRANHENKKWCGTIIKRGQFATSIAHLADETGLSIRMVRTSLEKLKKTKELTSYRQGSFSIITVNNWDDFQEIDKSLTSERQDSDNKQELKKLKEKEEEYISAQEKNSQCDPCENMLNGWFGEFRNVHLTKEQYDKLLSKILDENFLNSLIEDLSANIAQKKEGAPLYDEKFPYMHYVILEKYWKFRKQNPLRFKDKTTSDLHRQTDTDKILQEIRKVKEKWS